MSSKVRVFVPSENITDGKGKIVGGDAFHISKVMRLCVGDVITVCDMQRRVYNGEILFSSDDEVICTLEETEHKDTELPCYITVYQGVPKGDKLDTVIQKSVELGASRIVPVLCERSVSRPDKKSAISKNARYNKISEAAAKQSGRLVVPEVSLMISFDEMISEIKNSTLCNSKENISFVCYEGEENFRIIDLFSKEFIYNNYKNNSVGFFRNISFFIGPEGGISEKEIQIIRDSNIQTVTLGKRILRTETASLFVLSALSVFLE
ncbi:MAG: 16S rRNA (uracil(1498)-N(3))-methyltransferase [Clostridia bacterium]|nr:16S rRNA (uracil(1498)-N(3))-methyltransferase [Clostridia bacterium]